MMAPDNMLLGHRVLTTDPEEHGCLQLILFYSSRDISLTTRNHWHYCSIPDRAAPDGRTAGLRVYVVACGCSNIDNLHGQCFPDVEMFNVMLSAWGRVSVAYISPDAKLFGLVYSIVILTL